MIGRDLLDLVVVPGVVHVRAVGVADHAATAEDVEQVRVELHLLLFGSAPHVDPAQHLVPCVLRFSLDRVEVPAGELRLKIAPGAVGAGQGERDFHLDLVVRIEVVVADVYTRVVAGDLVDGGTVVDTFAVRPAMQGVEGRIELDVEEQRRLVPAGVALAVLDDVALQLTVADLGDMGVLHHGLAEDAAEVDDDLARSGLAVGVAMHADPIGHRELGVDVVAVKMQLVVTRLGDFTGVVLDVGLPAGVAVQLRSTLTGRGHDLYAGQLPVVKVAETFDVVFVLSIARIPRMVRAGIGAELDHTEWVTG